MNLKYLRKEARYYRLVDGDLSRVFKKFLFSKTPLKRIVNSDLYNRIYENMIIKKSKKIRPYIVSIENTNICNAKCIMCPSSKMKRKRVVMNQEDFQKIIDKIMKKENIKYIMFTGLGEPLCDANFEKKIEFLNKNYGVRTIVFTNAGLLTKERVERLLKLNIFKINFSVNGPEIDYNKNMGLDYSNSIKNINYFLERKKKLGLKFPITNVSIIALGKDVNKYEKFKEKWIDKVDSVVIFTPSNWSGKLSSEIIKKSFRGKRWPCLNLWKEIVIDAEGNVVRCHCDYESLVKIGNLKDKDYSEIDEEKEKIKIRHLNQDFAIPICDTCENSFDSSLDWLE